MSNMHLHSISTRGRIFFLCSLFLLPSGRAWTQEENLRVLDDWIVANNPGSMLIHHLIDQALELHDRRDREIARLESVADWQARQQHVSRVLHKLVGPFPAKTPLRPRVMGVIQKDGYRIEKAVFESMPRMYVVGCLFIPDEITQPRPAILDLMGHYQEAFRNPDPLRLIVNLVRKGFVVFTIDPPGQGENVQYFDSTIGLSSVGYSVIEHSFFGNQCFLAGVSPARYFVWDAIRSIDYLATRPEVDAARIGVTGFSGGGTITSYVAAFDERVLASAPSAWSTASRRQIDTRGAADAETEFLHGLLKGVTFEDLIEVRAPRPTLLVATTRDQYLPIQGAREAHREIRAAFDAWDAHDQLQYSEDDARHAFTKKNNEAIYAFFQKHLRLPGDPREEDVDVPSAAELQVTRTGQLSTSNDAKFIFDIQKVETEQLLEKWQSRRDSGDYLQEVIQQAQRLSGYRAPQRRLEPFFQGRYQRDGYTVGLYAIAGEGDYRVPLLSFVPDVEGPLPIILYLHPSGKDAGAMPGGEIEQLVRQGCIVLAVDVLGVGETANTATRAMADDYTALLAGRSVLGIQAGDIVRAGRFAVSLPQADPQRIGAIASRELCPALIHAAAFEETLQSIALIEPFLSYQSIATNRIHRIGLIKHNGRGHPFEIDFMSCVGGALTAYDLPDLVAAIAPRRVLYVSARDEMWQPAGPQLIESELAFPKQVFQAMSVPDHLIVRESQQADLVEWFFPG
jgi:cephalosporin-C deacetylase-like acetyl esterase